MPLNHQSSLEDESVSAIKTPKTLFVRMGTAFALASSLSAAKAAEPAIAQKPEASVVSTATQGEQTKQNLNELIPIELETWPDGELPLERKMHTKVKFPNGKEQDVILQYSPDGLELSINGERFQMLVKPTHPLARRFKPKPSTIQKVIKKGNTRVVQGEGLAVGHSYTDLLTEFPEMMSRVNDKEVDVVHEYDVYAGPYIENTDKEKLKIVGKGQVVRIRNEKTQTAETTKKPDEAMK